MNTDAAPPNGPSDLPPDPGTGVPGGGTIPPANPATITITAVNDRNGANHFVRPGCARALAGTVTVTGTVTPVDAAVSGYILYDNPDASSLNPFLQYFATANNNDATTGNWNCVWANVPDNTYRSILINASNPYTGQKQCDLHIVADYTGNECPQARGIGGAVAAAVAEAGAMAGDGLAAGFIEIAFAPNTVVAGEKFWVIVRGFPVASAPNATDGALPIQSFATPIVVVPGGSTADIPASSVRHIPNVRGAKLAVVEFFLPVWVRQARLQIASAYLSATIPAAYVIVNAI